MPSLNQGNSITVTALHGQRIVLTSSGAGHVITYNGEQHESITHIDAGSTYYFGGYADVTKLKIVVNTGYVNYAYEKLDFIIEEEANLDSGWASYVDTQYPDSDNAFTLAADTVTVLPNNAGTIIDGQKPADIETFYTVPDNYDGTNAVITGRNGDSLDFMLFFKSKPVHANQWLDIWIDIGGGIGEIYRETFNFPKGNGIERGVLYAVPSAYTLGTWQANGGQVKLLSNYNLDIYRINFNLDRSHKAR